MILQRKTKMKKGVAIIALIMMLIQCLLLTAFAEEAVLSNAEDREPGSG